MTEATDTPKALTSSQLAEFRDLGFLRVDDFIDADHCLQVRSHISRLVEDLSADLAHRTVFSTDNDAHAEDSWFLESGDKIRCFFEADGVHPNKIGHNMHDLDPVISELCRRYGFAEISADLGIVEPRLVQSMYIFKHPHVGGEVGWHTDHSFLWTSPPSVVGFWLAIDTATVDNGCLWVIPGGHTHNVKAHFQRNGEAAETVVFDDTPYPIDTAVPVEAKRGSLVLLDGRLPHTSAANTSNRPRHAFTLHVVSGAARWHSLNWLQRGEASPFKGFEHP